MRAVYGMSWGPRCYEESDPLAENLDELCLYTCGGEGVIFMHQPSVYWGFYEPPLKSMIWA